MADVPSPDELTQLRAAFPSLGELTQLPLRALVAYAARCARRVQPFFTLPDDHPEKQRHSEAVERAVRTAEEVARGTLVIDHPGVCVAVAAMAVYATSGVSAASQAAWASTDAARAAMTTTVAARGEQGSCDFPLSDFPLSDEPVAWPEGTRAVAAWVAYFAWSAAAAPWAYAANARGVVARSDFAKLRGLGLGRFPELGAPLDPSGNGPLGPLWPEAQHGADAN
jgi:hypothetical protein